MIKIIKFIALPVLAIAVITTMSCKKVVNHPDDGGKINDTYLGNYVISASIYDTLYMYAKAFYYWNSDLPNFETFNPVKYKNADSLAGLQQELYAFTQIPIYDSTHLPYEYTGVQNDPKYSYIIKTSDNTNGGNSDFVPNPNKVAITLDGKGNDMGIYFGFEGGLISSNQDSVITFIKYVVNGSPAQKAGLKRGDIIYSMNGQKEDFNRFGDNQNARNNYYNGLVDGDDLDLVTIDSLQPKSGMAKQTTYNLKKVIYDVNPILKDTILNLTNGKKVGYIAFENFTEMSNAKTYLDNAFSRFSSASISDIVVDLRYNGGGSVETSAYFANNLVPSGNDNKVLFTEYYNDSLKKQNFSDQSSYSQNLKNVLKSQKLYNDDGSYSGHTALEIDYSINGNIDTVKKVGSLNLPNKRVFFIVASGTASASELLINSLKPYMNTILVGALYAENIDSSNGTWEIRTYGKPVGFFDLRIGQYTTYMSMFETLNANKQGGYYSGMLTNALGEDDITADFADSKDKYESLNVILTSLDPNYKISSSPSTFNLNELKLRLQKRSNLNIHSYEKQQIKNKVNIMVGKPKFSKLKL